MRPRSRNSASGALIQAQAKSKNSGELQAPAATLVDNFFRDKDAKTIRTYKCFLEYFRVWMKASSIDEAASIFLSNGHGQANLLAMNFKSHLVDERYAPSSVNGHLTAIRSLVKVARLMGMVPWTLEVQNVQNEGYRDTSGPGTEKLVATMKELSQRPDPMGVRDYTILSLLHDAGLRRDELVTLDLEHVDWTQHRIWVKAKKRTLRVEIMLNPDVEQCLRRWIKLRGDAPGALFKNFDPTRKGSRLTGTSVGRICHKYGLGHAHGIRHLAITEALDATNGNIREVMKFSRHKDPKILMVYDDKRMNVSGEISEKLSRIRRGETPQASRSEKTEESSR